MFVLLTVSLSELGIELGRIVVTILDKMQKIEFCVNFDHINSPANKQSNTYTLKRINSDDSLP